MMATSVHWCNAFVAQSPVAGRQTRYLLAATADMPSTEKEERALETLESKRESRQVDENSKFECDEYVQFWMDFKSPAAEEAPEQLRSIVAPYILNGSTKARAYWVYHMIRSGYFTGNAVVGAIAHTLHERLIKRSDKIASVFADGKTLDRYGLLLIEAFISYEQNWKWVEKGILNYPWDAAIQASSERSGVQFQLDHKQSNPLFALSETSRLVRESIGVWGRRVRLEGKPSGVWLSNGEIANSDIQYPSYYLNDFHYQTMGWFSSESAENYEVSTESLFLGRQDSMQRQTLVPLKKHFTKEAPERILEVACGTGRFATFARDEFPTSRMTLVDLSPFYLAKARDNIKYWQDYRGSTAMKLATGKESRAPETTEFVQANAEKLPFPDNYFDAVTTVYLFHEMPHEARVNTAKELARVCKPGGIVVFSDSTQTSDRPDLADVLLNFRLLNEPHYESYLKEDIPSLFERHGLKCSEKYFNSRTKTLSFVKE
eukprot:scaffold8325_cov165-Amphora_coffeaeformis.AAC.2